VKRPHGWGSLKTKPGSESKNAMGTGGTICLAIEGKARITAATLITFLEPLGLGGDRNNA